MAMCCALATPATQVRRGDRGQQWARMPGLCAAALLEQGEVGRPDALASASSPEPQLRRAALLQSGRRRMLRSRASTTAPSVSPPSATGE